jgi:PAS domain S-box-containing protein
LKVPEIVQELAEEEKKGKLKNNYFEKDFFQNIDVKIEGEKDIAKANENFLSEVFNSIQDGISVLDLDLNIVKVNHFMEKMYSHKAPIIGKKCYFVYQNLNEVCPWCPTVRAIKEKKTCRSIVPYPDNENPTGWIELSSYPLINSSGDVYGVIEYVKDITELKSKEKKLALLSSVIKQSKNPIAILDVEGNVKYANQFLLNHLNQKEVIGKNWESLLSKNCSLIQKMPEIKEIVLNKKFSWNGEFSDIGKDGNVFWRETTIFPITNQKNEIEHIVFESKDITDIKKSEEKYRNLVELAPVGIITLSKNGTVTSCNPAFLEMSGYSNDEIVGKHFLKLPTISKNIIFKNAKLIKKIFTGENPVFEFEWIHKDGSIRLAEGRIKLIKKDGKTIGFLGLVSDITDHKKNEEELRQAHKLLKEVNKELEERVLARTSEVENLLKQKDEFINQLGHDLKNPLNPLVNLIPLIEKTETDSEKKEMLKVIHRNVGYMKNLVTKTIELGRLNSPNTVLNFENINLSSEVNKVISNNKYLTDKKQIEVINNITDEIIVYADKLFLEELFNNLINNSLKFTKHKGLITVDAKLDHGFVTVIVKDNGIGMNREQLSQIFDEFYKADISRHDFESSGLGMPICKRIVEKHGGKIWVESEGKGKGSSFYFTLRIVNENKKIIDNLDSLDRIKLIEHKGKEIIQTDFTNLKEFEYNKYIKQLLDFVIKLGKQDLLLLTDISGNYFSIDQVKFTTEAGKAFEPFIRKNAIVGLSNRQDIFLKAVKLFSGIELKSFENVNKAKDWLVE